MMFLAILGEAYSVVREEAQNEKARQVKTVKRGLMGWLKLIRLLIRAKLRKRRLAQQAKQAAAKPTSSTNKVMPTAGTLAMQEEGKSGGGGGGGGGGSENGVRAVTFVPDNSA